MKPIHFDNYDALPSNGSKNIFKPCTRNTFNSISDMHDVTIPWYTQWNNANLRRVCCMLKDWTTFRQINSTNLPNVEFS